MMLSLILGLLLAFSLTPQETRPKCNDIVGVWKWFVGPELTFRADHKFVSSENSGTWELTKEAERKYTLKWDNGGFVDAVTLSADGLKLTGTNNQNNKISGERVGACSK